MIIDWSQVIVSAIMGGVGSAIVALIWKWSKRK